VRSVSNYKIIRSARLVFGFHIPDVSGAIWCVKSEAQNEYFNP